MSNTAVQSESASLPQQAEGFDLASIWAILWRGKWIIVLSSLCCAVASITYALTARQWFRAEVVVTAASSKSSDGLAAQLGSIGGLASLAGISLASGSASEPLAVLKSRELAKDFIEEQKLLPILFNSQWDSQALRWLPDDPKEWPDIRDGIKYFSEDLRTIQEDKKSGLTTVSVEWTDARLAASWANRLIEIANQRMRQRALVESQANVAFLQRELAATTVVSIQQSLGRILDSEVQKLMLARGKQDFAFRVIDRAEVPKWRVRPKRAQIAVLGTIFGGVLGAFLVFLQDAVRRKRTDTRPVHI